MRSLMKKWMIAGCLSALIVTGFAQDAAVGLPFLKIGVGPRQAGMGHVFTGVADDIHALYWNPGGLGHLRRWQWSAAYNRWFTDVYQASFLYAKQFRAGFSRKATFGLMCSYVGMPDWDATGGQMPEVGANYFVGGISVGQRLDWLHPAISVGAQAKMINSNLATYSKTITAFDAGILIKPKRFRMGTYSLGIFDYGILTFGASILHFGSEVQFDQENSSLPQTVRGGASILMGRQSGWSLLLASDVEKVQNRDMVYGVGAESWWKNTVGVRAGYQFNEDDLGDLTFGFGFRWSNVINNLFNLPTRFGDTFEINLADEAYGNILNQTYRGSLSHYSVAPEPFLLGEPQVVTSQVLGTASDVSMQWEPTIDPDPFDEVSYIILIDKDKSKVDRSIRFLEMDMDRYLQSALKDSIMLVDFTPNTWYGTNVVDGGIYHWAVAAYDLDHHVRLAKKGKEEVKRFIIQTPDLQIKKFEFLYSPWITLTPEQGTLSITIGNTGNAPCDSFAFLVEDRSIEFDTLVVQIDTLKHIYLPPFDADQDTTIDIPWSTTWNGVHDIYMKANGNASIIEINKENNDRLERIVSIPKGQMLVPDSVEVMATGFDSTEIPLVPEVYFDTLSHEIENSYLDLNQPLPPFLPEIASRLVENSEAELHIMGSIDLLSGEKDETLASERTRSVFWKLADLGVSQSQLKMVITHDEKILGNRRRPSNPEDALGIEQQYRKVAFSVQREFEEPIFGPVKVAVDTTLRDSIFFGMDIYSPGQVSGWYLDGNKNPIVISRKNLIPGDSLKGTVSWDGTDSKRKLVPRDQWYPYSMILEDTLMRTFMTYPDSVYLFEKLTIRKREIFGAAKFAQTEPVYQFYWDRLMDIAKELADNPRMHVRFEGHACRIGPDYVNDRLSNQRAQRFSEAFKNRVKTAYPDRYTEIWTRIETPLGYGEKDPLSVRLKDYGEVLLGDNNTPVGRYYNRRIMVLLYRIN